MKIKYENVEDYETFLNTFNSSLLFNKGNPMFRDKLASMFTIKDFLLNIQSFSLFLLLDFNLSFYKRYHWLLCTL